MYNYYSNIESDIIDYINENYTADEIAEKLADRYEWETELSDDLWCCDSVTGNASGSYFCNAYKAAEAVAHNWDILNDALLEFGCTDCNPIEKGEEWCDVTIRCYLLGECIANAVDFFEAAERRYQEEAAR